MDESVVNGLFKAVQGFIQATRTEHVNDELINAMVTMACTMHPQINATDEIKQRLIQELSHSYKINQSPNHMIDDGQYTPWLAQAESDEYYSNRYIAYLKDTLKLPVKVVDEMQKTSRMVLDHLGNPMSEESFKYKGLVVGHVQSGKTANYLSLINLAADYGYKLVILIAGVHNNLRSQTQKRVNEGFIGYDSLARKAVGVGIDGMGEDPNRRPVSLTNTEKDFNRHSQEVMGFSPTVVNNTVIVVIKKNFHTLTNVINWLSGRGEILRRINAYPTLIIDDEADNASINTKKEKEEATRINGQIRTLLNMFQKGSYVGFTATPFANIFINPETHDEMLEHDLFPSNFIFSLETPENYIGPDYFFPDEDEAVSQRCRIFNDNLPHIPIVMRADHDIQGLPDSLKEAVQEYLLAAAVKRHRRIGKHSSMLVNISHRVAKQKQVQKLISDYLASIVRAIRSEGSKPLSEALLNPALESLSTLYEELEYENKPSFSMVLDVLIELSGTVEVRLINSYSKELLDYHNYEQGLNVIAIGGYSLSRGLTLEHLLVSYLIRNSKNYDTLLQMGRWFGYRDGYLDLCQVYLLQESYDWYTFISTAIQELRDEFKIMERNNLTPKQYGLKVRSSPHGLLITARNKMQAAETIIQNISFSLESVSTTQLYLRGEEYESNFNCLQNLVNYLSSTYPDEGDDNAFLWKYIDFQKVFDFLNDFKYSPLDVPQFQALREYLSSGRMEELETWDIMLPKQGRGQHTTVAKKVIQQQQRSFKSDKFADNLVSASDGGGRLVRIWEEKYGLSEEQAQQADTEAEKSNVKQTAKFYRAFRERPLLVLKVFEVHNTDTNVKIAEQVSAYGISFPKSTQDRTAIYRANTVFMNQIHHFDDEAEIDDEDEE